MRLLQGLAQEAFSSIGVAPGGEPEVDRLAIFVHRTLEVLVFPFDPNVGLLHRVALRGRFEMRAARLL